jgi:hypothetical protein
MGCPRQTSTLLLNTSTWCQQKNTIPHIKIRIIITVVATFIYLCIYTHIPAFHTSMHMHHRTRQEQDIRGLSWKAAEPQEQQNPRSISTCPPLHLGIPVHPQYSIVARSRAWRGNIQFPSCYYQGQQQVSSMIEFCERGKIGPGSSRRPSWLPSLPRRAHAQGSKYTLWTQSVVDAQT